MKVLVLSRYFYPEGSGKEFATYLHLKSLAYKGFDVVVLTFTEAREFRSEIHDYIRIYRFPIPRLSKAKIFEVHHMLFNNYYEKYIQNADAIYIVDRFELLPFVKRFRKPVVVHLHDYYPFCPNGTLFNMIHKRVCNIITKRSCVECVKYGTASRALLRIALSSRYKHFITRYTDAVLFVSKTHRELILSLYPKLKYINNEVVYNPLPNLSYVPLEGDDLGYVGGLSIVKGIHILLKAWTRIHRLFTTVRLRMTKCSSLSTTITSKLNIVTYGKLLGKDYEDFFRSIRGVIVPSIWPEPGPYASVEACLRGRVAIVSNIGGIPEYVGGLPGVYLITPGDVDELVKTLERVLFMTRGEVEELGLKNREIILRKFSNENITNRLVKLFEFVNS